MAKDNKKGGAGKTKPAEKKTGKPNKAPAKAPPAKPAKGGKVPAKAAKPEPKKAKPKPQPVPEYHGMRGVRLKKQKEAVDALVGFIRELNPSLEPHARITINGTYARVKPAYDEDARSFDLWKVYGMDIWVPLYPDNPESGLGGGSSWSSREPEHVALVEALEQFLESYTTRVKKDEDEPDDEVDEFLDAKWRLEFLWNLPPAAAMRSRIYYLLWLEKKRPGISLTDALNSRMHGFYDDPVRDDFVADVDSLKVAERDQMDLRIEQAQAIKPARFYELMFKGFDPEDAATGHLRKTVQAYPEGLQLWMAKHNLGECLAAPPRDIAEGAADEETVLRTATADVIITHTSRGNGEFHLSFTHADLIKPPSQDPALDWVGESKAVLAARRETAEDLQTAANADQVPSDEVLETLATPPAELGKADGPVGYGGDPADREKILENKAASEGYGPGAEKETSADADVTEPTEKP